MLSAEVIEGVVFIYWDGALAGTVDLDREGRNGVDLVGRGVYVEDPETYGVAWNCGLACSASESFDSPEEFEAETGTAIPPRTARRVRSSDQTQDEWMSELDNVCQLELGMALSDLPDLDFDTAYESGIPADGSTLLDLCDDVGVDDAVDLLTEAGY